METIKDFIGNDVAIGDAVAFIKKTSSSGCHLGLGKVIRIYRNAGYDVATIQIAGATGNLWDYSENVSSTKFVKL